MWNSSNRIWTGQIEMLKLFSLNVDEYSWWYVTFLQLAVPKSFSPGMLFIFTGKANICLALVSMNHLSLPETLTLHSTSPLQKPGLHVTFFCTIFLTILKWVEWIPMVMFTYDVTKCKKDQRCHWQKRTKSITSKQAELFLPCRPLPSLPSSPTP